jgi:putative oxidoreductase
MNTSTSPAAAAAGSRTGVVGLVERLIGWLESVPYSLLALPLRFAVATVFWSSGTTKLANWDATLQLFEDEYKVPLLPPDLAAHIGAGIELTAPVLLVLGLLTRPAALVLLGMTTIIEVFVYPQAWPTHIQWAAMLLVLLFRGAGGYSLDYLLGRRLGIARSARF